MLWPRSASLAAARGSEAASILKGGLLWNLILRSPSGIPHPKDHYRALGDAVDDAMPTADDVSISSLGQKIGGKRSNLRVPFYPTHGVEDVSGELASRFRATFGQVSMRGLKIQIGEP